MSEGDGQHVLKNHRERQVKLSCRLFFFGEEEFEGEGSLLDISTTGGFAFSSVPLEPGRLLKLSIFLPDHGWPLGVEQAMVRWVSGQEFE